jgi:beta-ribofuranosylaminobenzene 5'-phosphate synthase
VADKIPRPVEICVTAHARLHLGFLDLDGGLGRRFGCLGMAITQPVTQLRLTRASSLTVEGPDAERARRLLLTLVTELGCPATYRLTMEQSISPHAGLGSGTQLALAIGTAFTLMEGGTLSPSALATQLNRGARSGIGVGAFTNGGLIVDGGKTGNGGVPPIVTALPVPDEWRVILLFDHNVQGVHGPAERQAFQNMPPFPPELAAHLCRVTLMQALPAVVEGDVIRFGEAVDTIQNVMGNHFAVAQGGPYTSKRVGKALTWLKAQGLKGIGQSSWGPTGFAFVGNATLGQEFVNKLKQADLDEGLEITLTRVRNQGATVESISDSTDID